MQKNNGLALHDAAVNAQSELLSADREIHKNVALIAKWDWTKSDSWSPSQRHGAGTALMEMRHDLEDAIKHLRALEVCLDGE